jgi:hypothetical protein
MPARKTSPHFKYKGPLGQFEAHGKEALGLAWWSLCVQMVAMSLALLFGLSIFLSPIQTMLLSLVSTLF